VTLHLLEATALLSLLAAVPVIMVAGLRPASVFLCPLGGSLLGAWAAEFELVVGGSFTSALLIVAAAANGAGLVYLLLRRTGRLSGFASSRRHRRILSNDPPARQSLGWGLISLVVVSAALLWPLRVLGAPLIGYDANVVWLLHAILVYGGHGAMLTGLRNPVLGTVHAEYPPLVPASSAVGFVVSRGIDLQVGVATTVMLNACGLGVLGSGIAEMVGMGVAVWRRIIVLALAATICLVGFGIAGQFAVDGFADLTWAAPAAAAVVFGLVLPRSSQRLWVAWICLTVAALTKNEGAVAAAIIAALLAMRYVDSRAASRGWTWIYRAVVMFVLVLPGLTWSELMRHYHVSSGFFHAVPGQTPIERFAPTLSATTHYLHVVPVALIVLAAGSLLLRSHRRHLGLGHPGWLWVVAVANLVALIATYMFGAFEIHWWLSSSLNRTTIFTQLILYTDIAIWAAVAALPSPTKGKVQLPTVILEEASAPTLEPSLPGI
jgi:hypothetical protein